jgi:HK97 family phage portal protein
MANFLQRVAHVTRALTTKEGRSGLGLIGGGTSLDNPAIFNSVMSGAWQYLLDGQRQSAAGELVDTRTSLSNATVFAIVRVLTESIASLPLRLLKVTSNGRSEATNENLHYLLTVQANEEMSANAFWESMVLSMALRGNFYAQIQRDSNGEPIALWPLLVEQTTPMRDQTGKLVYRVNVAPDGSPAEYKILQKEDCLHGKLFGFNGLTGVDPITLHANAIGYNIAAGKYAGRFLKNSATPALALVNKSDLPLAPEAKTKMREDWSALQSADQTHRIAILDRDFELKQLSVTPEQAQFLQSREFSRTELCGIWRMPEHMISSLSRITNSNLQVSQIQFLTETLRPYLTKIELECQIKLLPRDSRFRSYEIQFDTSELLRGDSAAQSAWYAAGIEYGYMSPAEVRAEIGLNPAPPEAGLAIYRTPLNYGNSAILVGQTAESMSGKVDDSDGIDNNAKPALPTENVGAALGNYTTSYGKLFVDGVRRVAAGESIATVFTPLLDSIYDHVTTTAGAKPDTARMVEFVTKLEARSHQWTADNAKSIGADELRKVVRTFVFSSFEKKAAEVLGE